MDRKDYKKVLIVIEDGKGNKLTKKLFIGGEDFPMKNCENNKALCLDGYDGMYVTDYQGCLINMRPESDDSKRLLELAHACDDLAEDVFGAIKKRLASNLEIVDQLRALFTAYPDIRFGQLLDILELKPDFNEESSVTVKKLSEKIQKLKSSELK